MHSSSSNAMKFTAIQKWSIEALTLILPVPLLLIDATTVTTPVAEPLSPPLILLLLLDRDVPNAPAIPDVPTEGSPSSSKSRFTPLPFLMFVTVAQPPLRQRDTGTTP